MEATEPTVAINDTEAINKRIRVQHLTMGSIVAICMACIFIAFIVVIIILYRNKARKAIRRSMRGASHRSTTSAIDVEAIDNPDINPKTTNETENVDNTDSTLDETDPENHNTPQESNHIANPSEKNCDELSCSSRSASPENEDETRGDSYEHSQNSYNVIQETQRASELPNEDTLTHVSCEVPEKKFKSKLQQSPDTM